MKLETKLWGVVDCIGAIFLSKHCLITLSPKYGAEQMHYIIIIIIIMLLEYL